MIFEKAGINDLTHLVELRTDYLLEDYGSIPDEKLTAIKHNLPEYFRKHLDKDLFVFVCRDEEHIVSCCFLYISEKPAFQTFFQPCGEVILPLRVKVRSDRASHKFLLQAGNVRQGKAHFLRVQRA